MTLITHLRPSEAERVLQQPIRVAQELDHAHALLREALALVDHAASAFRCRFPSQPMPSVEWWRQLRELSGALQPKLLLTLAEKTEGA